MQKEVRAYRQGRKTHSLSTEDTIPKVRVDLRHLNGDNVNATSYQNTLLLERDKRQCC